MKNHTRLWRQVALTAAALAILGAGLSAPALADGSPRAEDCDSISNLKVSPIKTSKKYPRWGKYVTLNWDEPDCSTLLFDSYRVLASHDYRPQRSTELVTSDERARLTNLKSGRTYTFEVQIGEEGEFYQAPLTVSVTTAGQVSDEWVVSLGDSFISGEGGRWAGNTDLLPNFRKETDTGARSYFDHPDGETIRDCHRSNSAMIHIGVARSMNFACSGAITTSEYVGGAWKPGVDRVIRNDIALADFGPTTGPGIGQAEMLARFARDHRVKMVVLSIGGNNFYFSDIVETCVLNFLGAGTCSSSARLAGYVSETWKDRVRSEVKTAILEVVWAMRSAGYDDREWTLVQNLYPKPIATSDLMRYQESRLGFLEYRQSRGGCGMRDADADWAINTVLPTINQTVMEAALQAKIEQPTLRVVHHDLSDAFQGHELCNKQVSRVNSTNAEDRGGVRSWKDRGAADRSEWMKDIDISNVSATTKNESFHPSYWGQLALRNCLRSVWNGGNVNSGGKCVPTGGTNGRGEPNVRFDKDPGLTLLDAG